MAASRTEGSAGNSLCGWGNAPEEMSGTLETYYYRGLRPAFKSFEGAGIGRFGQHSQLRRLAAHDQEQSHHRQDGCTDDD